MNKHKNNTTIFVSNTKAYHNYDVIDTMETGIVLTGCELKSVLLRGVSLDGSYAAILDGELWLIGSYIVPYCYRGYCSDRAARSNRKLLCHKKEIGKLKELSEAKGMTLIPLKMYKSKNKIKIELGICRGKHQYDKRETIKNRDLDRYTRNV